MVEVLLNPLSMHIYDCLTATLGGGHAPCSLFWSNFISPLILSPSILKEKYIRNGYAKILGRRRKKNW